ncbi:NAD(P)H-dependent glycerol-3-phosphate dehydrogenase [Anianabacter salinae]|uniref:NAD(P)H-dependent glycerol-3-phosphate dehydrogenase n=1 Tax=Anianabacter salinae TaxID=2851023 RepID=UPI00225DDC76|nr:NAD(P)H-dependent glycerol-3-phosphate dehydrogenase [Anianabacter salinae]MBV0913450.1 NAD(P)-dependent glycerol-3-phosphate dehydrogenase [Anianabacter salinae]
MSGVAILGAGAFGTALAIALGHARADVTLWGRDAQAMEDVATTRESPRLPGATLPTSVKVTADLRHAASASTLLLALPMQQLATFATREAALLQGKILVACCKGIDLNTGRLPHEILAEAVPDATPALLSGPSFAADIALRLPTALTLAVTGDARALQERLSTPALRLYTSDDLTGVALGGAMKNVIAIGCGTAMGAGLGESARAALMTRGFAEMTRHALALGGQAETLAGLSGFGDLALTCTSEKSRNYRFGLRLGAQGSVEAAETTEGIATASALAGMARRQSMDLPVTQAVAALCQGDITVDDAIDRLLSRPLKAE